jgi:hypothetical protein
VVRLAYLSVVCCTFLACGRFGFSDTPLKPTADGGPGSGSGPTIDAAETPLICNTPSQFAVGTITAVAAAQTADGFALVTVDSSGDLAGWSYAFDGAQLAATKEGVSLGSNANGTVGIAVSGSTLMVAAATGMPTATGTTLLPVDAATMAAGTPSARASELAVVTPIAASGADSGGIAFASVDNGGAQIDARLISATGSDTGSAVAIIPATAAASTVSIATAGTGYGVAWNQRVSSLNSIEIELLDSQLNVAAGPVVADNLSYDAYNGRIAWAPTSNVYLASWHEKNATDGDDVWVAIFDSSLTVKVAPQLVAMSAANAVVATDGSGFVVAYETEGGTVDLGAVYVAADGTVTSQPVPAMTGTPAQWAMVTRAGQPVLVWTMSGGSGPNLSFDALCN